MFNPPTGNKKEFSPIFPTTLTKVTWVLQSRSIRVPYSIYLFQVPTSPGRFELLGDFIYHLEVVQYLWNNKVTFKGHCHRIISFIFTVLLCNDHHGSLTSRQHCLQGHVQWLVEEGLVGTVSDQLPLYCRFPSKQSENSHFFRHILPLPTFQTQPLIIKRKFSLLLSYVNPQWDKRIFSTKVMVWFWSCSLRLQWKL